MILRHLRLLLERLSGTIECHECHEIIGDSLVRLTAINANGATLSAKCPCGNKMQLNVEGRGYRSKPRKHLEKSAEPRIEPEQIAQDLSQCADVTDLF